VKYGQTTSGFKINGHQHVKFNNKRGAVLIRRGTLIESSATKSYEFWMAFFAPKKLILIMNHLAFVEIIDIQFSRLIGEAKYFLEIGEW
jgi:hypothetical protein